MSEWIDWKGGECPVDPCGSVEVKFRGDPEIHNEPVEAGRYYWGWHGHNGDIVTYRVVGKKQETLLEEEYTNNLDAAGWIKWGGGNCPVDENATVEVAFLSGEKYIPFNPSNLDWTVCGNSEDIVSYRVIDKVEQEEPHEEECVTISSQPYYLLFPEQNIQVKDVNKAFCNKHDALEERVFSSNEMAWIVQATQYIFRSPFKENPVQDLKKAVEALNIVINSVEQNKT